MQDGLDHSAGHRLPNGNSRLGTADPVIVIGDHRPTDHIAHLDGEGEGNLFARVERDVTSPGDNVAGRVGHATTAHVEQGGAEGHPVGDGEGKVGGGLALIDYDEGVCQRLVRAGLERHGRLFNGQYWPIGEHGGGHNDNRLGDPGVTQDRGIM